ncbi:FAD binding domain-containing protein [Pisolithus orientalis]|uniref:FAD binding domain-containing protein n=1 Tax=Pisolithus orientalis TaxID=936130 RepID=UPI002224D224|nr:FAD binding domain-containing protein [Pisolithus orientalis]KAI6008120.1 FAD binding domain-containing protein [Pisolithus orientalis]
MTTRTTPVLVVGAGPAGLVAALTLARNNVPVRIIEKESQYRRGQRGAGIQPRTFEAFHFLRVPEIHERASFFPLLQEHNKGSLEPLNTFPMTPYMEPTPAIPYYNCKAMGQHVLEAILREHLAKLGCTIELDTRLVSFTQDEKCVRVKLANRRGDDGEEVEEDIEVAYLIGADGAKGVTRKQLGLTFLGTTREDDFIVLGDIRLEAKGLDRDHWHFFGTMSRAMITLRPTDELGKDGWQFVMSSRKTDLKGLVRDKEAVVNCIKDFLGLGNNVQVKEVICVSEFRPNIRLVNKFGVGRIFVCGDAAHVHSPAGGQGLNSSVQDALNVAWKIALVYKGLSPASLLDTYTTERLPVITEMLGFTTELHDRTFDQSNGESDSSKQVKFNLEDAMRRGGKLYMLGVNYRNSPIVVDEFAPVPASGAEGTRSAYGDTQEGVLRAGDRAPDAPGLVPTSLNRASCSISSGYQSNGMAESTRMFDMFASTHHTVIIFAPAFADAEVRSVLVTLDQSLRKKLVRRVVVLPGPFPEADGPVDISSGEGQAIDADILVDQAGHAYRGYVVETQEIKVVVVRPDGVVGAIVRGVTGLEQYFEGVFGKTEGMRAK